MKVQGIRNSPETQKRKGKIKKTSLYKRKDNRNNNTRITIYINPVLISLNT